MVTQCADKYLHALAAGSTITADGHLPAVIYLSYFVISADHSDRAV
jgi:hypothetical protein